MRMWSNLIEQHIRPEGRATHASSSWLWLLVFNAISFYIAWSYICICQKSSISMCTEWYDCYMISYIQHMFEAFHQTNNQLHDGIHLFLTSVGKQPDSVYSTWCSFFRLWRFPTAWLQTHVLFQHAYSFFNNFHMRFEYHWKSWRDALEIITPRNLKHS